MRIKGNLEILSTLSTTSLNLPGSPEEFLTATRSTSISVPTLSNLKLFMYSVLSSTSSSESSSLISTAIPTGW